MTEAPDTRSAHDTVEISRVRWRVLLRATLHACATFLGIMFVVIVVDGSTEAFQTAPALGISPSRALLALTTTLAVVVGLLGGALSVAVAIVAIGPAWLVARALRRTRSTGVHLTVWAVFGALCGLVLMVLYAAVGDGAAPEVVDTLVVVVVAAVAVDVGWWSVSRSRPPRPPAASPRP